MPGAARYIQVSLPAASRRRAGPRRPVSHRLVPAPAAGGVTGPMTLPDVNVTEMLQATAAGDRRHLDALLAAIYQDLRRLAARHMRRESDDHTLQPTALVHEAYLKLIDQRSISWKDRVHFFAVASRIIRRILVDHARERRAAKRGGGRQRVPLEEAVRLSVGPDLDILALDEALRELGELDATQARIVELRFFSGLTIEEVAELLSMGRRSVDRQWQCAKAWLYCRFSESASGGGDGG